MKGIVDWLLGGQKKKKKNQDLSDSFAIWIHVHIEIQRATWLLFLNRNVFIHYSFRLEFIVKDLQSVFAKGKFNGPLLVGRGKKVFFPLFLMGIIATFGVHNVGQTDMECV